MQLLGLKPIELVVVAVGGAACAWLPIGVVTGEAGRLLTTFIGFFTASVLPTVSILVSGLTASGRSVKALNDVRSEIWNAVRTLLVLLASAGAVVAGLFITHFSLSFSALPSATAATPRVAPIDMAIAFGMAGQVVAGSALMVLVMMIFRLPAILRDALAARHRLAVDEARRKIEERAPDEGAIRKSFESPPEFGMTVRVGDVDRN